MATTKLETNDETFKHLASELAKSSAMTPERMWLRQTLEALILETPGPRRLEDLRLIAEQSTARDGGHRRTRITCPDASLTEDEVLIVQTLLGYHPAGYGFPAGLAPKTGNAEAITWTCSNTCD